MKKTILLITLLLFTTVAACSGGGGGGGGGPQADYTVAVEPTSVSAAQGSSVMIKVSVARNAGTSEEVVITLDNPPVGVDADLLTLPGSVSSGYLQISLAPDIITGGPLDLAITGTSGPASATAHLPLTVTAAQPSSQAKIKEAFTAGTIDYGTSLLYRAYALYGDARLPAGYVGSGSDEEDNRLRTDILTAETASTLSPDMVTALEPFTVRPADPKSWFNQTASAPAPRLGLAARIASLFSGSARSAAGASGWGWISDRGTIPVRVWAQTNGDPVYDSASAAAISDTLGIIGKIWGPMTALMGEPVYDQEGGDNAIDIYIVDWLSSVNRRGEDFTPKGLGTTYSDYPMVGKTTSAFILVPRSLLHNTRYHATVIHEFFHVLQKAHNDDITVIPYWFPEASARWAAVHFDRTLAPWAEGRAAYSDAHHAFTERFQKSTESLNSAVGPHEYDAYIWSYFLEQKTGGPTFMGSIWTSLESASTAAGADAAIDSLYSFKNNYRIFAVRNLNTEFLPGDPLPETDRYIHLDPEFRNDKVEPPYGGGPLTGDSDQGYYASLEPLSAHYVKFTVGDPEVKQVVFDLSGLVASPELDVDAMIKTDNGWEHRDLNGQAELKFCFDKTGEALEDIRIVLSNHQFGVGQTIPAGFNVKSFKAPCSGKLSGTTSSTITDATPVYTISAQVTWVYDPGQSIGNHMVYYPEGTVTFHAIDTCVQIVPSSYSIGPLEGQLDIDMSTTPPTYTGAGATTWTATYTDTCTPGSLSAAAGGSWFVGQGSTSADGSTITGTYNNGIQTYSYSFAVQ